MEMSLYVFEYPPPVPRKVRGPAERQVSYSQAARQIRTVLAILLQIDILIHTLLPIARPVKQSPKRPRRLNFTMSMYSTL